MPSRCAVATVPLRALELVLAQRLFARRLPGMTPTSADETLLAIARQAEPLVEDAACAVSGHARPRSTLRLGATDTGATVHLHAVFARRDDAYLEAGRALHSAISSELIKSVRDRPLECATVNTQPS